MSVDRRASAHAIISNFDSIFNPVPSTTPTVHGICAQLKDNISAVLERIHIMPPHPSGCKKETIFPKTKVLEILTLESVRRVLDCICNHCRCAAQSDIRNPDLPAVIHKDYRIILAILIYARRAYMITTFVLGGYTDKWVLEHPLDDDELLALQEGASQRLRLRLDTDFPRLFCDTQYQFLLPRLGKYVDPDADVQTFHYSTLLPFRFKGSMGSGAYGDVFKAELLEGYHGFDEGDVKVSLLFIT